MKSLITLSALFSLTTAFASGEINLKKGQTTEIGPVKVYCFFSIGPDEFTVSMVPGDIVVLEDTKITCN